MRCGELQAVIDREAYGRVARGYLVFLEQRGISDLADADGGSVLAFLESLLDRWAKSSLFWVVSSPLSAWPSPPGNRRRVSPFTPIMPRLMLSRRT
jgi:hypothetical protein